MAWFDERRNSENIKYQKMAWDYEIRPPAELFLEIEDLYTSNNLIIINELQPIVKELKTELMNG